ncbi:MAG TPA: hypothetical protein VNQ33_06285 [Acidimicrobiales bacterium]|nr:hypothetical protein [Acidimicrobiales bacterium]
MLAAAVASALLAQSSAPADTTGSNPGVVIVGVVIVTAVIATVVIRRSKR